MCPTSGPASLSGMEELWIVHRDPLARAALGRLAGDERPQRAGAPGDQAFEGGDGAPAVVLLGAAGDLEPELDFASRQLGRAPAARWILLGGPGRPSEELSRLFRGLDALFLHYPPDAVSLRAAIARAAATEPEPLPVRRLRELLESRARVAFADLDLPALSRSAAGAERALVRGEPGTGRLLLARWLHARGPAAESAFLHVPCDEASTPASLAEFARGSDAAGPATLCLDDVDRLAPTVQRWLRGVVEWGGVGLPVPGRARWIATRREGASAGPLDPALEAALGGSELRLPPLRERAGAVPALAAAAARAWAARRGVVAPRFAPDAEAALRAWPWPGNVRELEALVEQTLAAGPPDPVPASALRFAGDATSPRAPRPEAPAAPGEPPGPPRPSAPPGQPGPLGPSDPPPPASAPPPAPAPPGPAAPTPPQPRPAASGSRGGDAAALVQRLVQALTHEVRNPLVAIRTFASLLPERFDDPEFRTRFREQVGADVARLEQLLERLARFASTGEPRIAPVDVAGMLEALLDERRPEIQARRLLVLQELDSTRPLALADEEMLRFALEALLSRALAWIPERADLFVASRYHARGAGGTPTVRVLLRFYDPHGPRPAAAPIEPEAAADVSLRGTALEFVLAEQLVRAQGGRLLVDASEADETLVVLDLPALPAESP